MATAISPDPLTGALLMAAVFLVLVRFLDLWEREPLRMVVLMAVWGAAGATAIAAPLNSAIDAALSPDVSVVWGPALSAPLVEESAKGVALVMLLFASRWAARHWGLMEFDGPADGMVYGAAVGIGFAFAEDNVYFLNDAYVGGLQEGLRTLDLREGFLNLDTLGHAVYSASFGAGLGLATWSRTRAARIGFPLLGLGAAMFMHALHNGIVSFALVERFGFDATAAALREGRATPEILATADAAGTAMQIIDYGLVVAFFVALLLWVVYQRRALRAELADELSHGRISREEAQAVPRYPWRLLLYARLLISGRLQELRLVRETHRQLADLAFLKWRVRTTGGDGSAVQRLRAEIGR